MTRFHCRRLILPVLLVVAPSGAAAGQEAGTDTVGALPLEPVVVTVERSAWPLMTSAAAVSRIDAEEIAPFPQVTLADALRQVPGIAVVDFSGDGTMPQVMARGFYGGGEAEYVVVLLNGKPLNDVPAGLVRWDAVPLTAIERIEIVRGGASALYGDAAIGAVMNVITHDPLSMTSPNWSVAGGSNTTVDASVHAGETLFGRPVTVYAGLDRTEGFRDHSERTLARAGGSYSLSSTEEGGVELSALVQWRDFEEPGPLLDVDVDADRSGSDPFYRFDRTRENSQRIALDGRRLLGQNTRLDASIGGDRRRMDAIRTIALAPTFADTKLRELTTLRTVGSVQLSFEETPLPLNDRFIVGFDAAYGDIDSDYYAVLTGTRGDYLTGSGNRGDLDASGSGSRRNASAFAEYTLLPSEPVRLSLGLRADWLTDSFEPNGPGAEEKLDASHSAFSPKAGLNVRWLSTDAQTGHVYINAGRSFKAPTLDQLFDQRTLPVPFPPFTVTTSNPLLDPQYGTQVEGGIYHSAELVPAVLGLDISVSLYRMDMKDEIDFDLATLGYVNIARSRHQGLEASLRLRGPGALSAFAAAALQEVTARNGENEGSQLKGVPRQVYDLGVSGRPVGPLLLGASVSHTRGMYLDDANTLDHPAYTRVDSRLELELPGSSRNAHLFLDMRNLLDAHFSTTGYPDPAAEGPDPQIYYFPAAGRTLKLGVRVGS